MKSILFVSLAARSRATGVGKWTHETADGLISRGYEVTLWFSDNFPFFVNRPRIALLLFPIVLAYQIMRNREKIDVSIIHEPSAFWCCLARRVLRGFPPVIVMSHGVESRIFSDMVLAMKLGFAQISLRSRILAKLVRHWQSDGALRRADHVICLSQMDATYLRSRLQIGPGRITRMINGANVRYFNHDSSPFASEGILFVASWIDEKGSRLLPSIWRRYHSIENSARLTIVGPGCSREQVLSAFDPETRESVMVVPRTENESELAGYYRTHSIFIMPSLREGSPLALLEALASGMLVIASRVGGIPDIITNGVDGFLFDSMDVEGATRALEFSSQNADVVNQMKANAVERARTLTWPAAVTKLEMALACV